jgi:DNA-binding response OmpR family regulator
VRVLVVEDERKLAEVVGSALRAEHYHVVVASTGEEGFFRANAEVFDLLVLDVMLPGRSGLETLRALRGRRIETPVLILTARDEADDRVLGLDLGADDYLVKPFALPELLARIRRCFVAGARRRRSMRRRANAAIAGDVTGTQPTIYFLHYWGTGPADKLAAGFRAALDQLGKPKTTAAKR